MQTQSTQPVLDHDNQPVRPALALAPPEPPAERGGIAGAYRRMKKTLDEGESLWTPVLVLASGYAITIPAFLFTLGLAELAYHFG